MIVSIHQPNYLPWLGFFDKIKKSEYFVIFDNVQFPRGKNHFGHRNKIKTNNSTIWLTVPLLGKSDFKNFNEIKINYNGWQEKHLSLIESFYKKSPFFPNYFEDIKNILSKTHNSLCDLNTELILYFLKQLDIKTQILFSSQICPNEIFGSEKINYILQNLQSTQYISGDGPGSLRYINEDNFKQNNIDLTWQHYNPNPYKQLYGEFIPYMSIIDLLFNEGPNSKNII